MLGIKTFRDGDRLVVVFDGLKDIPSEERMVKAFLSAVAGGAEAESAPPAKAAPVADGCGQAPEVPEDRFMSGPFKGMTPEEAVGTDAGFRYVASNLSDRELAAPLKHDMKKAAYGYLGRKFSRTEPEPYAKKLTPAQLMKFLTMFSDVLPESARNLIDERGVGETDEMVQRKAVKEAVSFFRELGSPQG